MYYIALSGVHGVGRRCGGGRHFDVFIQAEGVRGNHESFKTHTHTNTVLVCVWWSQSLGGSVLSGEADCVCVGGCFYRYVKKEP